MINLGSKLNINYASSNNTGQSFLNKTFVSKSEVKFQGNIDKDCFQSAQSSNTQQILIKKVNFVNKPDIYKPLNQENLWALYDEDRFSRFVKSDKDLLLFFKPFVEIGLKPSLNFLLKINKIEDISEFLQSIEKKYNLDFSQPPKIYRFIGQSEFDVIKSGKTVGKRRSLQPGIDVTTYPELNFAFSQYRVTFKSKPEFSLHPDDEDKTKMMEHYGGGNEDYYWLLKEYNINDVEKIEKIIPNGLEEVDIKDLSR